VTYQRESREREQQNEAPGPPGPDDTIIAEGPDRIVYARKRRPGDEDDEPGWWTAEAAMNAGFGGGLPLEPAADEDVVLFRALTTAWCHTAPIRPRIDRYLAQRS
jgi:hypothetical protein